jgi:hypothetical protein
MKKFLKDHTWLVAGLIAYIIHFFTMGGSYIFKIDNIDIRPWIYLRNIVETSAGGLVWFLTAASITELIKRCKNFQWSKLPYWIYAFGASIVILLIVGIIADLFGFIESWDHLLTLFFIFPQVAISYFWTMFPTPRWETNTVVTALSGVFFTLFTFIWIYLQYQTEFKQKSAVFIRNAIITGLLLFLIIGVYGCATNPGL